MKKLIVIVVLLAGIGYGATQAFNWYDYQVYTPVSSKSQPVPFTVAQGEGTVEIGDDLFSKGLIRNRDVWNIYLKISGRRGDIQAGDFVLNKNMNMADIAQALQHGTVDQVVVRIPEGYPIKFVGQQLEQQKFGTAADYTKTEQDSAWRQQFGFLSGVPAGRDLEGYLFPDTYSLNKGATDQDLVRAQLQQFDKTFAPDWRQAIAQDTPARPKQTLDQIVILASMVEREVNTDADRPKVCEVYYNRLTSGERLDVDATILYAEGRLKGPITQDDLNINSPYNTRKYAGLPPGPISNPGAAALKACVFPDKNDYLFYFTDKNGVTHFEKTIDQFNADQQKYGVSGQ
ncbi:MAG TPA: endolytic transglycosylase MltG [Candidatus Dormibacteraeota bacterium]